MESNMQPLDISPVVPADSPSTLAADRLFDISQSQLTRRARSATSSELDQRERIEPSCREKTCCNEMDAANKCAPAASPCKPSSTALPVSSSSLNSLPLLPSHSLSTNKAPQVERPKGGKLVYREGAPLQENSFSGEFFDDGTFKIYKDSDPTKTPTFDTHLRLREANGRTPRLGLWIEEDGELAIVTADKNVDQDEPRVLAREPRVRGNTTAEQAPWELRISLSGQLCVEGCRKTRLYFPWCQAEAFHDVCPREKRFAILVHGHSRCGKDCFISNLREATIGDVQRVDTINPETYAVFTWEHINAGVDLVFGNTVGIGTIPNATLKVERELLRYTRDGDEIHLVLYFIDPARLKTPTTTSGGLSNEDLENIRRYRKYALVLVVISKCDMHSPAENETIRQRSIASLLEASIDLDNDWMHVLGVNKPSYWCKGGVYTLITTAPGQNLQRVSNPAGTLVLHPYEAEPLQRTAANANHTYATQGLCDNRLLLELMTRHWIKIRSTSQTIQKPFHAWKHATGRAIALETRLHAGLICAIIVLLVLCFITALGIGAAARLR